MSIDPLEGIDAPEAVALLEMMLRIRRFEERCVELYSAAKIRVFLPLYVGEEAVAWSGVAKIQRMAEWPTWTPTADIKKRMDVPNFVGPGPHNPMGARALYLYEGNKDTLYRIHGTNQPEYIGQAISSGCIRMTNEDVIDLYNRVKMGAMVVVLAPKQGDTPFNPRMALMGGPPIN